MHFNLAVHICLKLDSVWFSIAVSLVSQNHYFICLIRFHIALCGHFHQACLLYHAMPCFSVLRIMVWSCPHKGPRSVMLLGQECKVKSRVHKNQSRFYPCPERSPVHAENGINILTNLGSRLSAYLT